MFTEDFDDFFDPSELGDTASISGQSISGIFEHEYLEWDAPTAPAENSVAKFTTTLSSLPVGYRSSVLTIGGINYQVASVQPDGTGLVTLILGLADSGVIGEEIIGVTYVIGK